jgi:hypothetical protein
MDTELTDVWNTHLAPSSQVYAQVPGWYLADTRIPWAYTGGAAPFIAGHVYNSGGSSFGPVWGAVAVNGSGGGLTSRSVDLISQLNTGPAGGSGDFIQPVARQDSGGTVNLNTSGVNLPTTSIRWVCSPTGSAPLAIPPLTTVPNPITSAWMNANIRDTISFLIFPACMKAHYTAGSSVLANSTLATPQVVPLTTIDMDNYGAFTTGASAKYTIPVAGRYLVAGQVNLASSSTATWYACGVLVNSSTLYWGGITRFAGSGLAGGAGIAKRIRFNAGDTVQLVAAQASGGSIAYNTAAGNQTRLITLWEGL